jgi:hypothetical protein
MKTKLIVVPALIVISIILLIWFVYPAFDDSASGEGFLQKKEKLRIEQEKMKTIDQKIDNANRLSFEIRSNPEKQKTLFEFIPESVGEENIINDLNYLISTEGMAVLGISVAAPKEDPLEKEEVIKTPSSTMKEAMDGSNASSAPVVVPIAKPTIKDFEVKLSAIGDYQKVKNLAEKINRMIRFNKPALIEIKPVNLEGGPEGGASQRVDPNILQLDMTLQFSLLKKSTLPASADHPIFAENNFNMSLIDQIREIRNIQKADLTVGSTEEPSPFLP